MKVSKLFFGLFGLLALASCGEEKDMPNNPGEVIDGDSRFMSVTIRNVQGGSKAEGDQTTDGKYEEGLEKENKIESLRFYFFNSEGKAVSVKQDGTNFYDCTEITPEGLDMPNVEKKLKAVIVINTKKGDNIYDLKKMVAVANFESLGLSDASTDLETLRGIIKNFNPDGDEYKAYEVGSTMKPFVMTSSVFGSNDFQCEVEIKPSDIYTNTTDAEANPVDVFIERVLAKVRVSFDWTTVADGDNDVMKVIKNVSYDGKTYDAVQLKQKTETGSEAITADGKNVYAIFTGWCPTGVAQSSYAFKKVNSSWNLGWSWNDATYHRSYWAENSFADPTVGATAQTSTLKYFAPSAAVGKFGTPVSGNSANYTGSFYYIQENAATMGGNGEKVAYDPATQLSNRTQVYLGAVLVTLSEEADGATATALTLAEWGGAKYTSAGLIAEMLKVVSSQIYMAKKTMEGEKVKWIYTPLSAADVVLKSNVEIKGDLFDAEDDTRYMTYIQLKLDDDGNFTFPEDYEHKFYSRINPNGPAADGSDDMSIAQVNEALTKMPGAMVWKDGMTYYFTDIQHIAYSPTATDNNATKGGFGVVRNHIYDIELNTVYGLGTPIFTPEGGEVIIVPQKPEPEYSYIGARINVLSWRVVRQGVNLDWD